MFQFFRWNPLIIQRYNLRDIATLNIKDADYQISLAIEISLEIAISLIFTDIINKSWHLLQTFGWNLKPFN